LKERLEDYRRLFFPAYLSFFEEMLWVLVGVYSGVDIECFIISSKERDINDNGVQREVSGNHVHQASSFKFPRIPHS